MSNIIGQIPFERVRPITIYKERLQYSNYLFNITLRNGQTDTNDYSPLIKVGFLGDCRHHLDRLFVSEETEHMVIMVKNVDANIEPGIYKRTAYIIVRSKLKYVHFDTGYIISDIFDYAHIEPLEVLNYICFSYEDVIYDNIVDISSKHPNYKTKTKIIVRSNGVELINNLFYYIYNFKNEIVFKLGYYIPESSIVNFHAMCHIPDKFGVLPNIIPAFEAILNNPSNIITLINSVLDGSKEYQNEDLNASGKKKKKKQPKNKFVGVSLMAKLMDTNSLQMRKIFIGWFLCEVLYQFFFY